MQMRPQLLANPLAKRPTRMRSSAGETLRTALELCGPTDRTNGQRHRSLTQRHARDPMKPLPVALRRRESSPRSRRLIDY